MTEQTSLTKKVVTRFAPSPTGFMHVGGIRTALFAYLLARKNNGKFILRIEDTDKEREVPGSIPHIMESLRWLGIEWDYGPDKVNPYGSSIQSERLPTYVDAARKLITKGLAYPDPYSTEEVEAFRKLAIAEKRPFLFREHRPTESAEWDGKCPLRFRTPDIRRMHWHDAVRGDLEAGEEALDDFVLIKSDGYPTYNLAHIVDDLNMGVTHIMRADEFISSTPKFLSLYEALEIAPPIFVTLPPIMREDRTKKLGKRDGAKDILDYRTEGYLPDAMVNFLALTGWNPGGVEEIFTREKLVECFDISGIQKAGALLNEDKLIWVNKEHIKLLTENKQLALIKQFMPKEYSLFPRYDELIPRLTPLLIERIGRFGEIQELADSGELAYYFAQPVYEKAKLFWKDEQDGAKLEERLVRVLDIVTGLSSDTFTQEEVKSALWPLAESEGRGQILWPMRYALSGRDKSPDPFQLASLLGKKETVERLTYAIALCHDKHE